MDSSIHIEIDTEKNDIQNLSKYRYKKFFNENISIYFFGNFRNNIDDLCKNISNFKNTFSQKNLFNFFKDIHGTCVLLINANEKFYICSSIFNLYLRIFNKNKKIIISEKEFLKDKKLSDEKCFLKLFSPHQFFFHRGLSCDASDFIPPGSFIEYKKKDKNYEFKWYIDFNIFCSKSNHTKIVDELAENFTSVINSYNKSEKYLLGLSGGVDSALILALTHDKLDISPVHHTSLVYDDELKTSQSVSKYFNKQLDIIYKYKNKNTTLLKEDDISEYLHTAYNYISQKDSVVFFLANHQGVINKNYPNHNYISGDGFPMSLTLDHFMVYPDRVNSKFNFNLNKEKRFLYSINHFQENIDKDYNDTFNIKKKFPNISPYYFPILNTYFDQEPRLIKKFLTNSLSGNSMTHISPINNLSIEQSEILKKLKIDNAFEIFSKILKSDYFQNNLQKPDPVVAQVLFKFLRFLGRTNKEMHQSSIESNKNSNPLCEFTGLNTKVILNLLSVRIDDVLVNNAKWHIFKLFEKIANKKFEDLFKTQSLKDINFIKSRLTQKIASKFYKLPEYDSSYALVNNIWLKKFLEEKNIREKFDDFKSTSIFKKAIFDFPSDNDLKDINSTQSNLWKINNITTILKNKT